MHPGFDREEVTLRWPVRNARVAARSSGPARHSAPCGARARANATLIRMHFPFLDTWRRRHPDEEEAEPTDALSRDPQGAAQLLSECDLLREHARSAGVELDDSADSLAALDQLLPRWREDPEVTPWLGSDAGLYLGTVLVRTVPGAHWARRTDDQPVVRLASGREIDVLDVGTTWAESGSPELSQTYAEAGEG